jgi:hypothetical protein
LCRGIETESGQIGLYRLPVARSQSVLLQLEINFFSVLTRGHQNGRASCALGDKGATMLSSWTHYIRIRGIKIPDNAIAAEFRERVADGHLN